MIVASMTVVVTTPMKTEIGEDGFEKQWWWRDGNRGGGDERRCYRHCNSDRSSFVASSSPPLILFNLNLRTQITLATHTYQTQGTYLSSQAGNRPLQLFGSNEADHLHHY
ncbi:hypothetical protein HID58_014902 [Brassica napus]|uniref:Uncharacterized protein n=1 Tax=Brassica napus TaxID=3708 RepID=A0ABQ8BWQ2_BRANA|nr:hypothetical protein HID58_032485 [Brassica napus]KAH0929175.1 hypothetical protein HID58_014902 [Brassica napus]